jgi:hypothetical protein
MPEFFIALEYLKLSADPAARPLSPLSWGPTLFFAPGPTEWQAAHFLNIFFPASASCAEATAGTATIIQVATTHLSIPISFPAIGLATRPERTGDHLMSMGIVTSVKWGVNLKIGTALSDRAIFG